MSLRSDRSLALVLLAVLAVGLWTLRPGSDDVGPPYQLSGRGPTGLSGLGAGLREAGIAVHDSDQPTLADHGLTVVVEPYGISHDEADSWMRSLRNGATLVYASDTPDPFTQRLGIRYEAGGTVANLVPAHATFPQMTPPARVVRSASGRGGGRILSATGSGAAFAVIPVGRGTVWFLTDPVWLTNQRVAPTALPIVLPLAAAAGGSASFDRYHQSGAGHLNVLAYLPPVATLLVIEGALAVLMLVAAMLRRPGPVWPDTTVDPSEDLALAPSLAALYARGHHVGTVTKALADASERRMGARANLAKPQLERLRTAADANAAVTAWHELEQVERSQP